MGVYRTSGIPQSMEQIDLEKIILNVFDKIDAPVERKILMHVTDVNLMKIVEAIKLLLNLVNVRIWFE